MSKHADTVYCTDDRFKAILLKDKWNVCAVDIGRKNFAVCINNQDNQTLFLQKKEFTFRNPTELTSQITEYLDTLTTPFDIMVVESQYKEATKNHKSQETVETYCTMKGIPYLRRSARNKTESYYIRNIIRNIRPDYMTFLPKTTKKKAIYFCNIYHGRNKNKVFTDLFQTLKKKDDICDVFLMCLYENCVMSERRRINMKKSNSKKRKFEETFV